MGGIARQEQAAKAHGLGHKAAQRGDALFERGAGGQVLAGFGIQAVAHLGPEGVVAPVLHLVGQRHLQVVAAAGVAAHAAQRKAPVGVGVDQLVRHGLHIGQQAQPAKGVHAFVGADGAFGHAGAAHAVVAVAACDEVAGEGVRLAVFLVRDAGCGAVKVVHLHVGGFVHGGQACSGTGVHQVLRHLGLAVHRDAAATRQLVHVDAVALALEQQLKAIVRQAFGMGAGAHARLVQQVHGDLLQHACADTAEHVAGAALLNDDGINTRLVQQCAEQQARGARTNDGNLGSHVSLPRDGTLMGVNKQ